MKYSKRMYEICAGNGVQSADLRWRERGSKPHRLGIVDYVRDHVHIPLKFTLRPSMIVYPIDSVRSCV